MASAWEPSILVWSGFFQCIVAMWLWRSDAVRPLKRPLAALFLVNALAVTLTALGLVGVRSAAFWSGVVDRWTDPLLLAVALGAIPPRYLSGRSRRVLLAAALMFLVVVTGGRIWGVEWASEQFPEQVLVAAMIASSVALLLPHAEDADSRGVRLVVAILAMRLIEVAVSVFVRAFLIDLPESPVQDLSGVSRACAGIALAGAIVVSLGRAAGRGRSPASAIEAAILCSGLMLALAQAGSRVPASLLYFDVGFVRPLGIVWVLTTLEGHAWESPRWRSVGVILGATGVSTMGVLLAEGAWALPTIHAFGFGAGLGILSVVGGLALRSAAHAAEAPSKVGVEDPPQYLDRRATIPPDWASRLAAAESAYRALPPEVRSRIDGLVRWERLVLALSTIPDDQPRAYERTTPGLHLVTHCPYSNIGPELARVNERVKAICEAFGVAGQSGATRLVERRWGAAEGLRSGRASLYTLTPAGRAVAGRLQDRIGATDLDPERVRISLGESFGQSKAILR